MDKSRESVVAPSFAVSKRALLSAVGLLIILAYGWLQWRDYLRPGFQKISVMGPETADIGLMWIPIISYLLVGIAVCAAANIFKPLKYSDKGLIWSLVWGFVVSFVVIFIMTLFASLVVSLIVGLAGGFDKVFIGVIVVDFVILLVAGLAMGFVGGLIVGIFKEFK